MMILLKSSLQKIRRGLTKMTKVMHMIKDGKYVHWTEEGSRVESSKPLRDIDLEQLECYMRDNHPEETESFQGSVEVID